MHFDDIALLNGLVRLSYQLTVRLMKSRTDLAMDRRHRPGWVS